MLEPVLAHLLGVVEYRTTQAELDDSDLFEHRKIQAFLHMLDNAIEPGQRRIGIPFPLGFDDARDLESWPLIAVSINDEAFSYTYGEIAVNISCPFITTSPPVYGAS